MQQSTRILLCPCRRRPRLWRSRPARSTRRPQRCVHSRLLQPTPCCSALGYSHPFYWTATDTLAVHAVKVATVAALPAPAPRVLFCATQAEEAVSTKGRQITRSSAPIFSLNESSDAGPDASPTSAAPSLSSGGRLSYQPVDADGPGALELRRRGGCGQAASCCCTRVQLCIAHWATCFGNSARA